MKIRILLLLTLTFFKLNAQILNGKVSSEETKLPIPYARIGLEKSEFGVISDENGNFSMIYQIKTKMKK